MDFLFWKIILFGGKMGNIPFIVVIIIKNYW